MKDIDVVASFWIKPSFPPDRSGKPRLLVNASRRGPNDAPRGGISVIDQAGFLMLYNAGHENDPSSASISENMTLCGEPQWWDPKLLHYGHEPFRPQAFIFGRGYGKVLFDTTVPRYYASCQTIVNHQSHADAEQRSFFREHRWTHVVVIAKARPSDGGSGGGWAEAFDPPRGNLILVNGRQLKGTRETMFGQDLGLTGDAGFDFTVHRNGERNSIRFGMPSQVSSDGLFSGNFSCDSTIDEFALWNSSGWTEQQKALRGYLDGRYARPLRQTEDPRSSEGVFISRELTLPRLARELPPPARASGPASTMVSSKPEREILGMACTAYGEDAANPEMEITDEANGGKLPVRVAMYVQVGEQLHGPFRQDPYASLSARFAPEDKVKYLLRFEIDGLNAQSILLTTPVVDDVTLYLKPSGGVRMLYYHSDLLGGGA